MSADASSGLSDARKDEVLALKFRKYRAMCSGDPEDRIWAAVAEAFDMVGDGPRTIVALEQARAINPEWGRHRLQLGKAYLRCKTWRHAIAELQACSELDSSGCDGFFFAENVLYYMGYALFGEELFKEAAEAWRGADSYIQFWRNPEPLKDFHLHRGWAHHLEHDLLGAIESYRRGLIAPGPGDCSEDDEMDYEQVERSQSMNPRIEVYYNMAKGGEMPERSTLNPVPYTN